jgi:enamine deaminase RidA (YjgF/YER057c/UK114 family)
MNFSNVVAANVYLNNIDDFAAMNSVYQEYFKGVPPARTTIQQVAPVKAEADAKGHWPDLEQVLVIAVK